MRFLWTLVTNLLHQKSRRISPIFYVQAAIKNWGYEIMTNECVARKLTYPFSNLCQLLQCWQSSIWSLLVCRRFWPNWVGQQYGDTEKHIQHLLHQPNTWLTIKIFTDYFVAHILSKILQTATLWCSLLTNIWHGTCILHKFLADDEYLQFKLHSALHNAPQIQMTQT
jgi:hypothetical protein